MRNIILTALICLSALAAKAATPRMLPEKQQDSALHEMKRLQKEGAELMLETRPLAEALDSLRLRYAADADFEELSKKRRDIYSRLAPAVGRYMRVTNDYRRLSGALDRRRLVEGLKVLRRQGVAERIGTDFMESREYSKINMELREHANWLDRTLKAEQREFAGLQDRRKERRDRILYASIASACALLIIALLVLWARRPQGAPPRRRRA